MEGRRMMTAADINGAFRSIMAEWMAEDMADVRLVVRQPETARLIASLMPLAEIICTDGA